MSQPIKPAYEVGKFAGALGAINEAFVAKRVGLDTYRHFGITINWRKFAGMIQALVAFELLLAAAFTGRGFSIFGRAVEVRLFHNAAALWTSLAFAMIVVGGVGLYLNKRWAFLLDGVVFSILLLLGSASTLFVFIIREAMLMQLVGALSGCLILFYATVKTLTRYKDFQRLFEAESHENPIPAKNS